MSKCLHVQDEICESQGWVLICSGYVHDVVRRFPLKIVHHCVCIQKVPRSTFFITHGENDFVPILHFLYFLKIIACESRLWNCYVTLSMHPCICLWFKCNKYFWSCILSFYLIHTHHTHSHSFNLFSTFTFTLSHTLSLSWKLSFNQSLTHSLARSAFLLSQDSSTTHACWTCTDCMCFCLMKIWMGISSHNVHSSKSSR